VQSVVALLSVHRSTPVLRGLAWTGLTALVMFALAVGKAHAGKKLAHR